MIATNGDRAQCGRQMGFRDKIHENSSLIKGKLSLFINIIKLNRSFILLS